VTVSVMSGTSRTLLIGMTVAFAICLIGLVLGIFYSLFEYSFRHRELWSVLSGSILFYKILGALGIVGFVLFFAFLISLVSRKRQ
jgi:hypothetical protein